MLKFVRDKEICGIGRLNKALWPYRDQTLKLASLVFLISSLLGCAQSHNIDVNKIDSVTVTYTGTESRTVEYNRGSEELEKITSWLSLNRDNWKSYVATAAPGRLLIKGKGFSLNVATSWVILNYEHEPGEYRQLSKQIGVVEFSYLERKKP